MPFPWKKAKVTRITRMVADLQSPKRGGSLVVETGFPTSLIDLFVKNRDKLRRSSVKKKKKKHKNKPITDNADPFAADDPTPIAGDDSTPIAGDDPTPIAGDDPTPVESEIALSPEAKRQSPAISPPESTAGERRGAVAAVFLAAMRVFAVAALALSTKKLVIGVTLSAFLLLFLEFAGKGLVVWLIRPMKNDEDEDEDEYVAVRELAESRSSATESSRDEEILAPDLELLSRDRKWGFLESNCVEREKEKTILVVEKSKSKSKRAIIRRKIIKNFVPKKLRSAKKSKKLNFVEVLEELEEEAREGLESREIFEANWIREEEEIEEEEEVIELLAVSEDSDGGREENWVVAMMLVVVVLLGLFGGRIFALLLTIVWCFAMKLIGIGIQKRSLS